VTDDCGIMPGMRIVPAFVVLLCAFPLAAAAQPEEPSTGRVLEIRSYNLKPGTRDAYHRMLVQEALPMLQRWKVDVVAYGPSAHDADSYFLMRAFPSVKDREASENAFYGSDEWRNGLRERVLAAIDSYTTIVVPVDDATLKGLRGIMKTENAASDLEVLVRLNNDYIESVRKSDVKRFREILADDFLCTLADGTLVNRAEFLDRTAQAAAVPNLQAHDVNVRLLGDIAIVHARTTFARPDGAPGAGRYTDIWARRKGQWVAVAAHVTRQ
jgi:ketosteroid isomerase-like protein